MTQSIIGSLDQSVTRIHEKAASQHRSGMSTKKKVGLVAAGLALIGGAAAIGVIAGHKRGRASRDEEVGELVQGQLDLRTQIGKERQAFQRERNEIERVARRQFGDSAVNQALLMNRPSRPAPTVYQYMGR